LNDYKNAEDDFKKSLELNPDMSVTMYHYIIMLIAMDRLEEAIDLNERSMKKSIHNWDFSPVIYAAQGKAELDKEKPEDVTLLFMFYSLLGMNNEAIDLLANQLNSVFCWDYGSKYKVLLNDPFCKNLQNYPSFQKIVEEKKKIYDDNIEKYRDIEY
jgi:tetratricopeptide (TPR) repeat protein